MSGPANPLAPRPRGGAIVAAIDRVRRFTRSAMELADDEPVAVTEIACRIPGCPPIETVIVAMPHAGHWLRTSVHKSVGDVEEADVLWALRSAERVARPGSARAEG
jgi:hypothetical protein